MLIFTSLSSPWRSLAIFSSTGETAWHGPHHSAQKSTRTGVCLEPSRTSASKVPSVTSSVMRFKFLSSSCCSGLKRGDGNHCSRSIESKLVRIGTRFTPLPPVPDHAALEHEILALWED